MAHDNRYTGQKFEVVGNASSARRRRESNRQGAPWRGRCAPGQLVALVLRSCMRTHVPRRLTSKAEKSGLKATYQR